jgi:hypothetical protein
MSDSGPKAEGTQALVEVLTTTAGFRASPLVLDVSDLKQHPVAEQLRFTPLTEKELQQLADSIAKHGIHERIVLYEEQILEGWHRYQALKRIGRGFAGIQFTEYHLDSGDPELYVIARNAFRRHLSPEERRALGVKYFKAMPKETPGPKPEIPGTPKPSEDDTRQKLPNSVQLLHRIPEEAPAKDVPAQKSPYQQRLEEAAAKTGTTPGAIRAGLALEKKGPQAVATRAAGQKPPRAPRKPKRKVMEFKDGHTLGQIFHEMFLKGLKTLEVIVVGQARAIVTLDADVKPIIGVTESEIIKIAAAQNPPISELDAIDMLDRCKAKTRTYDDWGGALRTWRRHGWLLSQELEQKKPPPQRASPSQRTPVGRSTVLTPTQADRAAAELERKMKASLQRDGQ